MTIVKKIKNNSGSDKFILTRIISDQEYYTVPYRLWVEVLDSEDTLNGVLSGDLIVNDGTSDLNAIDGVAWLNKFQLEESLISPKGSLDVYNFVMTGSANNKWLEHCSSSINSNESPALLPFDCQLIACTFTNDSGGVNADIEIYKSIEGSGSTSSLVSTFQIINNRVARFSNFTPIQFSAGDKISIFLRDKGTNPNRVVTKLYFMITNHNKENSAENFSSDFSLGIGGITITLGS